MQNKKRTMFKPHTKELERLLTLLHRQRCIHHPHAVVCNRRYYTTQHNTKTRQLECQESVVEREKHTDTLPVAAIPVKIERACFWWVVCTQISNGIAMYVYVDPPSAST